MCGLKIKIIIIFLFVLYGCAKSNIPKRYIQNEHLNKNNPISNYDVEVLGQAQGILSNNIKDIIIDKNDVYCLTDNGLSKINKANGRIINYSFTNKNYVSFQLIKDQLFFISPDGIDYFYASQPVTLIQSPNILPPLIVLNSRIYFVSKNGHFYELNLKEKRSSLLYNMTNRIPCIVQQINQNILITDKNNVFSYDIEQGRMTNMISLSTDEISSLSIDENNVYFGQKQLWSYNLSNHFLSKTISLESNQRITCLSINENYIYIGQTRGILSYDKTTKTSFSLLEPFAVQNAYINCIVSDENILWIGTKNYGVLKYFYNR